LCTPVLTLKEVKLMVGFKNTHIYGLIKQGRFPRQFKPGGSRSSRWSEQEIKAWMAECAKAPSEDTEPGAR
jgi:prophage regulatory protein